MPAKKPSPEMKAFMLDLADVLGKHDATIAAVVLYRGCEQVELCCKGSFETDMFEIDEYWLREEAK
ncbi:MAG: hypothetical protein IH631_09970 [Candidatus Thorarchaeota archaeon]|nr:hypothetical protein [Candidatus Thorarchaeota archaeon]